MKKTVLAVVIVIILVVLTGVLMLVTRKAKAPVIVSRTDPPKISFEEKSHELGTVMEGVEIPYIFKIHNVGGEVLEISNVTTTCGCTLLKLKDKFVEPGKTTDLEVVMDTAMKQGYVKKTIDIFSNDPKHPKTTITIAANVLPNKNPKPKFTDFTVKGGNDSRSLDPHMGLSESGRAKIFTGNCATCHVNMGKGKMGGDLYQADCAMCHGQNAEGAVGPALVPGNYHDQEFLNRIQKVTRYGSDRHASMPGFLKEAGGPLTDGEINSIVQYLQNKSEQVKSQGTQVPGG